MNYFELYNLPVSFHPDAGEVKKKYYELSRLYHPDRFTMADSGSQADALRMSAMNNDAYKVLNNADAVMAYILKLRGLLEDEEKYTLPPSFLMEMMDLNEAISDYETTPGDAGAQQQATQALKEQLADWETATRQLTARYSHESPDNALLAEIKDQYFRKKYLLRIKERIDRFATR